MNKIFVLINFYILIYLGSVNSHAKDKRIEEAIKQTITDPIYIGNFIVGPGNGVLRVNQRIYFMLVKGFSTGQLKVTSDLKAGVLIVSYAVKQFHVYVQYDIDGYCLFMPIWGKGKGVVVMDNVTATINGTVATTDKGYKIIKMKVNFDANGGSINLSSLFGENPAGFWTHLYQIVINANAKYILNDIIPLYIPESEEAFISLFEPIINVA